MTFHNAIAQRQAIIASYRKMLTTETSEDRITAIKKQIKLINDELDELKVKQQQIFGKKTPLTQETTIIEPDHESKSGQKVTVLNPTIKPKEVVVEPEVDTTPVSPTTRLTNNLRNAFKPKLTGSAEDSLKAKIAAAKAAKKTT